MKRTLLTLAIIFSAQLATAQPTTAISINRYNRYNRSYGYDNVPFDGRYGIPGRAACTGPSVHWSSTVWSTIPGYHVNMDGTTGNVFSDKAPVGKTIVNPFVRR